MTRNQINSIEYLEESNKIAFNKHAIHWIFNDSSKLKKDQSFQIGSESAKNGEIREQSRTKSIFWWFV